MICSKCGAKLPKESVFCNKCGEKILNEEINNIKIDNEQEKEVNFSDVVQVHKKSKFIMGIIFILLILIFSATYYQNIQIRNRENAIKKKIEDKIIEADKLAQSGNLSKAVGILRSIEGEYNLSKYLELKKEISTKENQYNFENYRNKLLDNINKNTSDSILCVPTDLENLLEKFYKKKETKKLCSDVLNKIELILNEKKEYNYTLAKILTRIAIAYPEDKQIAEELYNLNESYQQDESKNISFDDMIDFIKNPHLSDSINKELNSLPTKPSIGMTADEVRKSTWGNPSKINKTTIAYGVREQWIYSLNRYIYLEDGIVTAIQE